MIALMNFINFPKTSPVSVVVVVCFISYFILFFQFQHFHMKDFQFVEELNRIKILNLQQLYFKKKRTNSTFLLHWFKRCFFMTEG